MSKPIRMVIREDTDWNDGFLVDIYDGDALVTTANNFDTVDDAKKYIERWKNIIVINEVE